MKEALFDILQAVICGVVAGFIPGFVIGAMYPELNPLVVSYLAVHQIATFVIFVVLMVPVSLWRQKRRNQP